LKRHDLQDDFQLRKSVTDFGVGRKENAMKGPKTKILVDGGDPRETLHVKLFGDYIGNDIGMVADTREDSATKSDLTG
jgi:hypothetical protein